MKNKIFLWPLSLAVIFFASFIILFSPLKSKTIIKTPASVEWKTYTNNQFGFEFNYPTTWDIKISLNSEPDEYGTILTLQSPETKMQLENKEIINQGFPYDFAVSYYSNINNQYLLGGSWNNQKVYQNLSDLLNDPNSPFVKKVGSIILGNQPAYKVTLLGESSTYGILVSTKKGIYEISFPTAWDESKLTDTQKHILSTFKFTP